MIKIQGTPISFWERSIFAAEKPLRRPSKKPRKKNIHEELNQEPQI